MLRCICFTSQMRVGFFGFSYCNVPKILFVQIERAFLKRKFLYVSKLRYFNYLSNIANVTVAFSLCLLGI